MSLGPLRILQWIPVTLFAALMQALRTGLQARRKGTLRAEVVSFARFLYALPWNHWHSCSFWPTLVADSLVEAPESFGSFASLAE
ncbi:MAG: hypothetical protein JJ693_07235 [Acidithiobacillus sp.]|nr:hypothetical protein [Acidithiobacillus sp.]